MSFSSIIEGKPQTLQQVAMQLKGLALKADKHMQEHVYLGAKHPVALYSIGTLNNVLFGIQVTDKYCVLYLHYTDVVDTLSLKIEGGEGNHAKHIKLTSITPELEAELKQVMKNIVKASKN